MRIFTLLIVLVCIMFWFWFWFSFLLSFLDFVYLDQHSPKNFFASMFCFETSTTCTFNMVYYIVLFKNWLIMARLILLHFIMWILEYTYYILRKIVWTNNLDCFTLLWFRLFLDCSARTSFVCTKMITKANNLL